MFHKIAHDRTADAVIGQIEALILEGVLHPGDRLPAERELALRLDVSRPILREALKALEERGLLRTRHGEGTFVAEVTGAVFTDAMTDLVRRNAQANADYLEFRRDIEGIAAAHAAERATEADRAILDETMAGMLAAHRAGDPDAEARIDVEFHNAVIEAAHNLVLLHVMRSCYRLIAEGVVHNRLKLYRRPDWREALLAQHCAIHSAIVARRPEEARAAAERHIDFIRTQVRAIDETDARQAVAALRLESHRRAARLGPIARTAAE
ncbi:FCD domain-containing protein [Rhizobiales bacterium L72]|uniref:Pyruvate dehydrogenase complex repressor n=2 Tax=Propylenella binzhouense TaxID=2555902 RepID=A0A964WVH1_9HYPH|nr:FCD domain-containing protein [Propylenella binzhouense]